MHADQLHIAEPCTADWGPPPWLRAERTPG